MVVTVRCCGRIPFWDLEAQKRLTLRVQYSHYITWDLYENIDLKPRPEDGTFVWRLLWDIHVYEVTIHQAYSESNRIRFD